MITFSILSLVPSIARTTTTLRKSSSCWASSLSHLRSPASTAANFSIEKVRYPPLGSLLVKPNVNATPGELRHIHKLRFWPVESVLHDKYLLPRADADMISSFLTPMMRLNPEKRARAADMVNHAWLEGIVVQGEIDLILMAEAAERKERGRSGSRAGGSQRTASGSTSKSKSKSGSKGGSQRRPSGPRDLKYVQAMNEASVADAMRPVDEAALLGGGV